MRKLLIPVLATLSLFAPLTPATSAPATTKDAKPALEKINPGELRLDGQVTAVLGEGEWQMEAVSWTSPRGVRTDFDDVKTKSVSVGPKAFIHPVGEADAVALKDVKIGSRVAVIGKNGADGTLVAREVVLLEGYGSRKTVGSLETNPETGRLIELSRRARDQGQLPKALQLAQRAADTAQGLGDASGEAFARQDLALLYDDLDQPQKALQSFARVQALGEQIGNPLAQVLGMNGQGSLLAAAGKTDEAIALLQRAVEASASTPLDLQVSSLRRLGAVQARANKTDEAKATFTRLFDLQENAGKRDDATDALLVAAVLLAPSDAQDARGFVDQAKPRLEFARDAKKASLTLALAVALKRLNDPDAPNQFEAAAKLADARGDTTGAAKIRALATSKDDAPDTPAPKAATNGEGNGGGQDAPPAN